MCPAENIIHTILISGVFRSLLVCTTVPQRMPHNSGWRSYLFPELLLLIVHASFAEINNIRVAIEFSYVLWSMYVLCLVAMRLPYESVPLQKNPYPKPNTLKVPNSKQSPNTCSSLCSDVDAVMAAPCWFSVCVIPCVKCRGQFYVTFELQI